MCGCDCVGESGSVAALIDSTTVCVWLLLCGCVGVIVWV